MCFEVGDIIRNFEVTGLQRVESNLRRLSIRMDRSVNNALDYIGRDLKQKSNNIVPVDTQALKDSSFYAVEDGVEKSLVVAYDTDYAVLQHEEMTFFHPRGGQSKYLQQPFEQNAHRYFGKIADNIKLELE